MKRRSELERLRAWKAEAMFVLGQWEQAWEAAGRPGALGTSKAIATAEEIRRLRDDEEFWRCRSFEHRCHR